MLWVLIACWGVDCLIGLSHVSFPASVALLVLLFILLIFFEFALGEKKTRTIVRIIDIPVSKICTRNTDVALILLQLGFALRYINVFFTPSFGPSVQNLGFLKALVMFPLTD